MVRPSSCGPSQFTHLKAIHCPPSSGTGHGLCFSSEEPLCYGTCMCAHMALCKGVSVVFVRNEVGGPGLCQPLAVMRTTVVVTANTWGLSSLQVVSTPSPAPTPQSGFCLPEPEHVPHSILPISETLLGLCPQPPPTPSLVAFPSQHSGLHMLLLPKPGCTLGLGLGLCCLWALEGFHGHQGRSIVWSAPSRSILCNDRMF